MNDMQKTLCAYKPVTFVCIIITGAADKSADALAFETLIPKSIIQRYVSLLVEHRRIILCGPSGTGKTFLAHRLAEYLVLRFVFFYRFSAVATLYDYYFVALALQFRHSCKKQLMCMKCND